MATMTLDTLTASPERTVAIALPVVASHQQVHGAAALQCGGKGVQRGRFQCGVVMFGDDERGGSRGNGGRSHGNGG